MKYRIPHYFEDFKCTASNCEDTCCAGWAIMIDDDSLEKYKGMQGELGERLRRSVDWENGCFCQQEKRCAFLNDDNLCDLHLEAGEGMLCATCRDYPRHMEEFEGLREGSLSLSCIEAAKLILGCKEPVRYFSFEDDVEDEEYEEFDYLLFDKLMDAREKVIEMLQNRKLDMMVRIAMVLELSQKMQDAIDCGETFQIDELLERFGEEDELLAFQQRSADYQVGENEYCNTMRKMFRTFGKLEVLNADWPEYVKRVEFALFGEGQRVYIDKQVAFHKASGEQWSIWLEQMMVYYVFTYFCGAVYDGNVIGKIKTAIFCTIMFQEFAIAKWQPTDGAFSFQLVLDIAHRISREVEHSDVNLVRLEKIFEKTPIFETKELLKYCIFCGNTL